MLAGLCTAHWVVAFIFLIRPRQHIELKAASVEFVKTGNLFSCLLQCGCLFLPSLVLLFAF